MRISTKGRGIIKAQQGTVARPNPKENYKLPEDQRYQAQTRGMKDFAIEWSKAKHSRLLKQIRVKALSFPSDIFCLNEAAKDADVSPYMKSDEFEVTIGNLREYQE